LTKILICYCLKGRLSVNVNITNIRDRVNNQLNYTFAQENFTPRD